MSRLGTVLSLSTALALVCGAAAAAKPGPKPVTQPCVLGQDALGQGDVGVSVTAYGPLSMTVGAGTNLSEVLPAGDYSGTARVLKDKKRSRLDFAFNENGGTCRLPESGDGPPPIYDPEVCRYHLILEYGIYDRGGDLVTFRLPDSRARLWDYQQELNPETGILDPIATGQAILDVQFE